MKPENTQAVPGFPYYFDARGYNQNDGDSAAAQKVNNDLIWKNCAKTFGGTGTL